MAEAERVVDVSLRAEDSCLRNRRIKSHRKGTDGCENDFDDPEKVDYRSVQSILFRKEFSPKLENEVNTSVYSGEYQEKDTTNGYLEGASPKNYTDLKKGTWDSVPCPNQNIGCKWVGRPEDLDEHLNKLPCSNEGTADDCRGEIEGCGYQTIHCPECEEDVTYISMAAHLEGASHQVVPCEYTGCDFECPRYLIRQHKEVEMQKHIDLLHTFSKQERDRLITKNAALWYHMRIVLIAFSILAVLTVIIAAITMTQLLIHSKRIDMLRHVIKKDWDTELRDVEEEITVIKETLRADEVKLVDLQYDVKELKSGFSKKYIDDTIATIRQAMCTFLPRSISGC